MKDVSTLKDLMVLHLLSLYDAETLWSNTLKETAVAVSSYQLKRIFAAGSKRALEHAEKVKSILISLGKSTFAKRSTFAIDFVKEIKELQESTADHEVLDAGLIVTHQCMNHYLIAKYGTVSSFARLLQQEQIAVTLHQIMEEEKTEDRELSKLAEDRINLKAKTALI